MRKSGSTVRFTADQMRARRERGESGSDWARAAGQPLPDGSDPDDAMEPVDAALAFKGVPPFNEHKTQTTLRLDSDVLRWFKAQGKGYQSRINAVLRSFYEHNQR